MDSHFVWNAILTIGMTGIGALTCLGGKYLAQIHKSLQEQLTKQDKAIEQVREDYKNDLSAVSGKVDTAQDDLSKFKILVQRDFVSREEYIRTIQGLDAKIDRLLSEINLININMAKLVAAQEVSLK